MAGKERKKIELPFQEEGIDLEKKLAGEPAFGKDKENAELLNSLQFRIFSSKYVMRNGSRLYIPTAVHSFSSELVSNVNYIICRIIEGDDIPSDMPMRKRHSIMQGKYQEEENWGEIVENYSLNKPEGENALLLKIKSAQDSLLAVENTLSDLIVKENLFILDEKYPEFDPLNNLNLYGNSSIISSLYLKRIANPFYKKIFDSSNNCANVFKDYFMVDMALKMCENMIIPEFSIPEGYLNALEYTITKSKREYEKSFYDLMALESMVNREISGEEFQ